MSTFFLTLLPYAPHLVLVLIVSVLLYKAHSNAEHKFNIFDYFMDAATGKPSITRSLQLLAGITATWVVVTMTVADKLTYEFFGLYLAAMGISEGWSKLVRAKFSSKTEEVESKKAK